MNSNLEVAAFEMMADLLERSDARGIIVTVIPEMDKTVGLIAVESYVIAGKEDLPSVPKLLQEASVAFARKLGTTAPTVPPN